MYRLSILLLITLFYFIITVTAGPGTAHRFDEKDHSNYGSDKTNKQHLQEHLDAMTKEGEKATQLNEDDMIYYLFVLHDKNGDGHLDGHELRAAFSDFDHDREEDPTKFVSLEDITLMVDHVLGEDDLDGDGMISWEEYMQSQLYHGKGGF
ncbi:uncharacterized protein BX664DRAFT_319668 [Halteromyces radiatus]|uniref:uncharacterized protein n=1 Tax=Halteromyces radiatus TaxID=101107 RepID=UPI00221FBC21|nr:uncharacterized protein BX664DRAFT_319668 [Halteromyces radiatus]KAI8098819.1 hypothetical protein BX664DRAFT_319668 [Halteromyces radiatus]